MANTIKLKRGSGSDPSASDLSVGEVALRTDSGKLFTKKDDNSIAEIGGSATVADGTITNAKIASDAAIAVSKLTGVFPSAGGTLTGDSTIASGVTNKNIDIDINGTNTLIRFDDDLKATFGDSDDLQIFHDDTDSNIYNATGNLRIRAANNLQLETHDGEMYIKCVEDGAVEIYHDNSKKLETTSSGVTITGGIIPSPDGSFDIGNSSNRLGDIYVKDDKKLKLGDSADLEIFHNGSDSIINDNGTGTLQLQLGGSTKFEIQSGGVGVTGNIAVSGTVDGRDLATDGTKLDGIESGATADQTKSDIDALGIAASTATTLATARTIAGVSFDGSANISLNNNAITNGAGYLTSVDTSNIADDAITNAKIDGGAVNSASLGTDSVATAKIQDDAVTADKLASNSVTNAKVAANAISTATILDDNVTYAKIQNVSATNRILGRDSSGAGVIEEITPANLRTMLNVADGATNVTNNNQLTNGAGYITSADGGNAATLDSIDSSQFLRSDTTDSSSAKVSFNGGIAVEDTCSSSITTLSDGSTVTANFTTSIHHVVTLGGNRTLSHSNTSSAIGQCGSIFIIQDGTGSRTLSFNSAYKFAGGTAPTLSTAASAVDRIDYVIRADSVIHCAFTADVK